MAKRSVGQDEVISTGGWIVTFIILVIPIVGLVMYFVWAFGRGNLNRRNFARASLILVAVCIVLAILSSVALIPMFTGIINSFM